ncbi:MAG TPA: hypothetical protein VHP37_21935 [Burkholderiales bacterium]|nr:hypothetical protein [Burkholderiales bacterium]
MTGAWEFVEDSTGRWRWRTSDASGLPRESSQTFRSGADCVAHALRHGYLAGSGLAMAGNRGQTPIKSGAVPDQ